MSINTVRSSRWYVIVCVIAYAADALGAQPCATPDRGSATASAAAITAARTPLWGVADTHTHLFANLAFGEHVFWGSPFDTIGPPSDSVGAIARALASCAPIYGPNGLRDLIGTLMGGHIGHSTHGMPDFTGWPEWNTLTHQQMYVDWLDRARAGGLRLVVTHAVNAEALCRLRVVTKAVYKDGTDPCDDMNTVGRQLDAVNAMQAYVDARAGGPGRGWFRIVRSPEEARAAIAADQIAVVLGIEVDNLFGCYPKQCSSDSVTRALETYYRRGVRHIFPIHLANNVFGGPSLFLDWFYYNTYRLTRAFPEVEQCQDTTLRYHFSASKAQRVAFRALGLGKAPDYPTYPHCNKLGLTPLGEHLVVEMMKRGMILDIDHMSAKAAAQTLRLARPWNYPISASHTGFLDLSLGTHRHEGQKTAAQLAAIQASHGMVSAILTQGRAGELKQWVDPDTRDSVANSCPESSRAWVQAYLYAVHQMKGFDGAGVGFASDQPFIPWTGPRFGRNGCTRHAAEPQADSIVYPFTLNNVAFPKSRTGKREFNFNHDGFAEIGLLPDFIRDLKNLKHANDVGLSDRELGPLYRSAERYVEMWERAIQAAASVRDSLAHASSLEHH